MAQQTAVSAQNTANYAQDFTAELPAVVSSLAIDPVSFKPVFYGPTGGLYGWNPVSESWRTLVQSTVVGKKVQNINVENATIGQSGKGSSTYLANPAIDYLEWQFIYSGSDTMAMSTSAPNMFIRGGSGTDAIQVATGKNVLDGGLGSNWLVGGDGQDTFFTDARGGSTWSTIGGYDAGDAATIWGFVAGTSQFYWEADAGAEGWKGATLRVDLDNNGGADASVTFAGLSLAQAGQLQVSTGAQEAGTYLALTNPKA